MIKPEYMAMAFIVGILLGGLFFFGLWITVKQAIASKYTALWFLASSLLRTGLVIVGFYYMAQANWQRLFIGVLGFLVARSLVIWLTKSIEQKQILLNKNK